jgi:hypothetical protein
VTKIEVQKLVAVLLAAFPSARITEGTSAVYESMLADLDHRLANAAVQSLIATARFMPTIAEIRDAVVELQRGPRRAGGDAWGDVLRAVSTVGRYRFPSFDDGAVAAAVDALGWQNICDSENQVADRARFIELYDKLSAADRKQAVCGQLPAVKAANQLRGQRPTMAGLLSRLAGEDGES